MKKRYIVIILVVILAGVGIWKFIDIYQQAKTSFAPNVSINGVDCSRLTAGQAEEKLIKEWNSNTFLVKENGKVLQKLPLTGTKYDIGKQIEDLIDPNPFKTVWRYLFPEKMNHKLKMKVAKLPPEETDRIRNFGRLDNDYKTKTKDAYVDLSSRKFKIIKEVYGDNIDKNRFSKRVKKEIAKGNFALEFKEADYYELPKLKKDSEKLADYREWCKDHLSQKITYRFREGDQTLTPAQINKVVSYDSSDNMKVSKKKIEKLIFRLAYDHNTTYSTRKFKTHYGKVIKVRGGDYGWRINRPKEEKRLARILKEGSDKLIKPSYMQKPYYRGKGSDIGKNYVEVDLGSQELHLFKKGKDVLVTSIVSGSVTEGHATPEGTYKVDGMQTNTVLRGFNNDGSTYETHVTYWMPFNGGIGFHDATWRNSFGGGIYYSSGSHGCINMPYSEAASLYSQIKTGFPVVVHY